MSLDEQFKILNNEGKGTGSNIRVLKYKLNITKNEAKHSLAQLQKLKAKLDFAENISKERDHAIFLLKEEINSLKNKKIILKKKKQNNNESLSSEYSENETLTPSPSLISKMTPSTNPRVSFSFF